MLRRSALVTVALLVFAGSVLAADTKKAGTEVTGKVVKVDADKGTITITTEDGKTRKLMVAKDAKFVGPRGGVSDMGIKDDRLTAGNEITAVLSADGKSATEVRLPVRKAKAPDDAANPVKKPADVKPNK